MQDSALVEFTNRQDAIELFNYVREQGKLRSALLPILAFTGPVGSGKSTLLRQFIYTECISEDRKPTQVYAYIDFAQLGKTSDIFTILVSLRDQLYVLTDADLRRIIFPRFDLTWLLLYASSRTQKLSFADDPHTSERDPFSSRLGKRGEVLGTLREIVQDFPSLADKVRDLVHADDMQEVGAYIAVGPAWQWQRDYLKLEESVSLQAVLQYSMKRFEETAFAEQMLVAALLADLRENFERSVSRAWPGTRQVILFLDSFEQFTEAPAAIGIRLLTLLAFTSNYNEFNPLLLVLGSSQRLNMVSPNDSRQTLEHSRSFQDERQSQYYARETYQRWQRELPMRGHPLELRHLYLNFLLLDFTREDIEAYIQVYSRYIGMIAVTDRLIEEVVHATSGHPLALRLVTEAIHTAQEQHQTIRPRTLEHVVLSSPLAREFLAPLSPVEQQELALYALPRVLPTNLADVQALLQLAPHSEMVHRWRHYQNLNYLLYRDEHSLVLHPLLRKSIVHHFFRERNNSEQYKRTNELLYSYFQNRAREGEPLARLEAAYHALAIGNAQPAIAFALICYKDADHEQLHLLLEAIQYMPAIVFPADIEAQAAAALQEARATDAAEPLLTALVLYTWLLSTTDDEGGAAFIRIFHSLGSVYSLMTIPDHQANIQKAIDYYDIALELCQPEQHALAWADLQQSLGTAYTELTQRDRLGNLEKAIDHYNRALSVYKKSATPVQWARALSSLGKAFFYFPGTTIERRKYLGKAALCFEEALTVYQRQAFPFEWASIKRDLGNIYLYFPSHEQRQEMLQKAVACYGEALQVYTHQRFPAQWAMLSRDREQALLLMAQPGSEQQLLPLPMPETSEGSVVVIPELDLTQHHALLPGSVSGFVTEAAPATPPTQARINPPANPPRRSFLQRIKQSAVKKPKTFVVATITLVILVFLSSFIYVKVIAPHTTSYIYVHLSNNEMIGISDGNFFFDTPEGHNPEAFNLKKQATQQFVQGHLNDAERLWRQSLAIDPTDAETQIYLEDQRVLDTGQSYLTIFLGVTFGGGAYSSREIMQGAYIEQYEWNKAHKNGPFLRLLIANSGYAQANAKEIAQQVVQQYQVDPTAFAVMGWPGSSTTLNAGEVLNRAHVLMVSQLASADSLSKPKWPYFFRIVPLNRAQAEEGAKYAIKHYHHVALFINPSILYSQNLGQDFVNVFQSKGGTIVANEMFDSNHPEKFPALLQDALRQKPDFIYFAGNSPDVGNFLQILPRTGPSAALPVMTGDTAYALVNYPGQQKKNLNRVFFTSVADPDSWDWLHASSRKPPFFADYAHVFSADSSKRQYGATLAGAYTLLSYDAMAVLLKVTQQTIDQKDTLRNADALRQKIEHIKGKDAMQGVSGRISFNTQHDTDNKTLVIVKADNQGTLQIQSITGCFFVDDPQCSE